jgi:Uma2 family endonuclease
MTTFPRTPLTVPPLENGDRLSRDEFERRYAAMPDTKAELIEGVVYVASPVRLGSHGRPHSQMMAWVSPYWVTTLGVDVGIDSTVRLDSGNEPQPDILIRLGQGYGGKSRLTADDYVEGPPELVIEIAASTATFDLYEKKTAYGRNGIQEYIVWQMFDRRIDWFYLDNDRYVDLEPDEDGLCRSRVFPGLWLDPEAMVQGNLAQVLARLNQGLQSTEHQTFVEQLQSTQGA